MINHFSVVWLIAKRDWREAASRKIFWFGILLSPFLMVGFMALAAVMISNAAFDLDFPESESYRDYEFYSVIDHSGFLGKEISDAILAADVDAVLSFVKPRSLDSLDEPMLKELQRELQTTSLQELSHTILEHLLLRIDEKVHNHESFAGRFANWWLNDESKLRKVIPGLSPFVEGIFRGEPDHDELLRSEEILGYFVIPENLIESDESVQFFYTDVSTSNLVHWYGRFASEVVRQYRAERANIDVETFDQLSNVSFSYHNPIFPRPELTETTQERSMPAPTPTQFVPMAYQYILFFMVLVGSAMLLTSTVEEKASRLVEVILSNTDSNRLMDGKLLGIALILLTIIGAWLALTLVFSSWSMLILSQAPSSAFNLNYMSNFVVFFVLGYGFYGYTLSAIGSVCSNIREAQPMALPINLLMVVSLFLMFPIALNPDAIWVKVLYFFPPFTPFVMMSSAASLPELPLYVLVLAWMILATLGVRWVAGRIYARGILMEDKPRGLKNFVKLAT